MPELRDATVTIGVPGLNGGGVTNAQLTSAIAGLAPATATYITQTSDGTLSAEQALADLSTGILKVTTGTGVLSTATGADLPAHSHTGVPASMAYTITGGGVAIVTGLQYGFRTNNAGTITGWDLGADQNTTSSVQVWKDTTANFPPTVADLILTMSTAAGTKYGSATGLSIPFSVGDWFYFNVSANNSATVLLPNISYTRTI